MTPTFVAVLPAIIPDLARRCIQSMAPELRAHLLLVDNTETGEIADEQRDQVWCGMTSGQNAGVTGPWNLGLLLAIEHHAEWLVIISQSMHFGAAGGLDLLNACEGEEHLVHSQYGWHYLAIARKVWERVGAFDPVFPAYGNESDYLFRMGLAGLPSPRENEGRFSQVMVNASCEPDAACLRSGVVTVRYDEHLERLRAKWGGPQGEETFTHPYGDLDLDWTFTGDPPGWETQE